MFPVFQIIAFELVAVNSPYSTRILVVDSQRVKVSQVVIQVIRENWKMDSGQKFFGESFWKLFTRIELSQKETYEIKDLWLHT